MRIIDLAAENEVLIRQVAELLFEGFKEYWPEAWPDLASARQEVQASFGDDRLSRVAVDDQGQVLGWIGGIKQYEGHVWELHPLVVRPDSRQQGVGRALVNDLEEQVRRRGGLTLCLGTDDEANMTTLGGQDLYPDVLERLAGIRNLKGHPYEFYQKVGFVLIGVMPDANGPGKPDIYMAKRVGAPPTGSQ